MATMTWSATIRRACSRASRSVLAPIFYFTPELVDTLLCLAPAPGLLPATSCWVAVFASRALAPRLPSLPIATALKRFPNVRFDVQHHGDFFNLLADQPQVQRRFVEQRILPSASNADVIFDKSSASIASFGGSGQVSSSESNT